MKKILEDIYGYSHTITNEISRGGQGAVFRTTNANIALKLEIDCLNNEFKQNPSGNDSFNKLRLLPIPEGINLTLPIAPLKEYSGYTMTLLSDMESFSSAFDLEYKEEMQMNDWLKNIATSSEECARDFTTYMISGGARKRLKAYLRAATILSQLHMNGLVYCDFSPNNIFVSSNKELTNVWIIDADNLNYQNETVKSGIYTPLYGAPEVVQGKGCTMYSDVYSFAISLFWQITRNHPFKGALLEASFDDDFIDDVDEKVNNGEFPWVLDEDDDSNHIQTPIPAELVLNKKIISLLNKTFSEEGRKSRTTRPTIYEWCSAIAEGLDSMVECSCCNMNYDREKFDICPWCDNSEKMIAIRSFDAKNELVGKYYTEIKKGTLTNIPLRLAKGFFVSEVESDLFELMFANDKVFATNFNANYTFENLSNSTFKFMSGRVEIQNGTKISCSDEKTGQVIVLEVSIS